MSKCCLPITNNNEDGRTLTEDEITRIRNNDLDEKIFENKNISVELNNQSTNSKDHSLLLAPLMELNSRIQSFISTKLVKLMKTRELSSVGDKFLSVFKDVSSNMKNEGIVDPNSINLDEQIQYIEKQFGVEVANKFQCYIDNVKMLLANYQQLNEDGRTLTEDEITRIRNDLDEKIFENKNISVELNNQSTNSKDHSLLLAPLMELNSKIQSFTNQKLKELMQTQNGG